MLTALSSALLALSVASAAHGAMLVDTGTPPSSFTGYALDGDQDLGVSFEVPFSTVITGVQGFMMSIRDGTLSAKLYAGDPGGAAVFTSTQNIGLTFDPTWVSFDGLGWAVAPGTYTLTFEPVTFDGYMPYPSPSSLAVEWNNNFNQGWNELAGIDGLGFRVEVMAVPEPATWLLFAGGCAAALGRRTFSGPRQAQRLEQLLPAPRRAA